MLYNTISLTGRQLRRQKIINTNVLNVTHMELSLEEVKNLQKLDFKCKKSRCHYRKIGIIINDFNRSFDNTVVDTHAFYQVITSQEINTAIYCYMYIPEFRMKHGVERFKKAITEYIIDEVGTRYKKINHSVYEPEVYYDYINNLMDRLKNM